MSDMETLKISYYGSMSTKVESKKWHWASRASAVTWRTTTPSLSGSGHLEHRYLRSLGSSSHDVTVAGMGRGSSVLYFHPILEQKLPKIGRKYTKIGLKRSPKANFYSKRLKIGYNKVFLPKTR